MKNTQTHRSHLSKPANTAAPSWLRMLRRQTLWMALTMALGLPNAQAQVHPDGGTATGVLTAPNGVPVVNIATPNAAGLSHNTYQQFDVGNSGLILNNSGAISKTQQAGYINGNPNLSAGQAATLILNEVTSTLPSQLNGALEVAGPAAQVIVANPNGITCTGCGFINTPRGVLTTGTPILASDGSLSALRVTGGTITVNGTGLNGTVPDQVDLIARAVAINAGVWANKLNVVTGANQVDYATLATQNITGSGTAPVVSLDVSALGGMYANVIRLVGTEAGVGVNSQGQIAAQNGDLSITSAGQVVLGGKTTATGNLSINAAQSLTNQGTLAAGGTTSLSSTDLTNSGVLYSGSAIGLTASGQLTNSGQIQAQSGALTAQVNGAVSNTTSGSMYAGGPINLTASSLSNAGKAESAQGVNLQLSGDANNSGTILADTGNYTLDAVTIENAGTVSASGNATLSASSSLNSSGTLVATGAIALSTPSLTTAGVVQAGSTLNINGGTLTNSGKLYALGGGWITTLSGAFANQNGGDIYGSQSLTLGAASLLNVGGIEAQQAANVNLSGALTNSGKLQSDQSNITLNASSLSNTGALSAYQNLQWQVVNAAQNSGVLVSGQAIGLVSGSFDNQAGGQVQSGTSLILSAATLDNEGNINTKGNATLNGATLSNASGAQWITAGTFTLNQTGNVSNAGVLQAGGDLDMEHAASLTNGGALQAVAGNLTLTTGTLGNTGTLSANGSALLNASGSLSSTGTLIASGAVNLASEQLTTAGTVQAGSTLILSGGTLSNSGKLYALGGNWTGTLSGAFTNQVIGDIYSSQGLTLGAASLINAGGIEAQQAANVTLTGTFANSGKLQSDQSNVVLNALSFANTGTLSAYQNLQWQVGNAAQNSGVLVSGLAISLTSGSFDNQAGGQLQSGANLTLSAATLDNEGNINAKGNAALSGTTLSNASGAQLIAAGTLTAAQTGSVSNAGVLQSGSDFNLTQAASVNNAANATMYAGQDFNLALGQSLTNAGILYATHTATLSAGSVNNTGTLRSGGALALTSTGAVISSGAIEAQQSVDLQSAANFTNSGQLYAVDGGLMAQIGGAFSTASTSDIYSGQNIGFNANSFANAGTLEAKQGVNVVAQGNASNSGTMQADSGNLVVVASALINQGAFSATGNTQLTASGNLSNSGQVVAGQALSLTGADVTNSGQAQSTGNTTVQAAAIDNSGRLQSGGTLAFNNNATLTNEIGGSILAASDISTDTSSLLSNAGVIQAGGNLAVDGTGAINNAASGTLYGTQQTNLQLGGAFASAGTVYGGQGINLTAASVSNAGSLRSNTALGVVTQGNASNSGNAYALGDTTWNIGGTLTNSGVLASADNTTLTLGSLAGNGTLAAGLQSGGTLGTAGALNVVATGGLASNGHALAAGNLSFTGSSIDLSGSQTRAGNNITLSAGQGNVTNVGGDLAANGIVSISTSGGLINGGTSTSQGGKISASTLSLHVSLLDNEYGSLTQTGSSDLNLSFTGAFENAYGKLASNAGNLTVQAASLDNIGGTIQQAGSGALTLDANGDFTNTNGQIAANGSLSLQSGGTLGNAGGMLSVAGNASVNAANFNNAQGKLIANNVGLTVAQALTNTGGTLQSAGTMTIGAGSLVNTAGVIKVTDAQALGVTTSGALTNGAGGFIGGNNAVTVNAGSLVNAGQIYAGTTLNTTAQGNLTNDNGALQAMSSLSVSSGGALSNRSGQLEAGAGNTSATLGLSAAGLDNSGGRIADSGQGSTTVNVAQTITNEGGTLGGQGAVTLSAGSMDNSNGGHLVAGQSLGFNFGGMNNTNGTVYAAGDLNWNNGGASLANNGGNLGAGGNLALALSWLDNTNGAVAANDNATLSLGNFGGTGRIAAGQNLTLTSGGGYTNAVGNQLVANGNMTLNLGGNFSNASGATLQAVGNLTVNASNIDNAAGATVNSNNTTLSTGGSLTNEGSIQGGSITLNAGTINNTSNIIGGTITANAWNLTNGADLGASTTNNAYQSALIAGSNSIALYVGGTLLNRDATIFTTGDLTLAANAGGGSTVAVTNLSGDIEADGNATIDATQFTNQRRVFQTTTYNLTAGEQAQNTNTGAPQAVFRPDDTNPLHQPPNVAASQVLNAAQVGDLESFCGGQSSPGSDSGQWCNGVTMPGQSDPHDILHNDLRSITTATLTSVQLLSAASAEGRLLASGNITLNGSVLNDKSTISAGQNLTINGQGGSNGGGSTANATVQNIAFVPTGTLQESINEQTGIEDISNSGGRHWAFLDYQTYGTYQASVQVTLGSSQANWITYNAGNGLAATMSAGNTVSITAQTINNTTVGADGQPVHAVIGLGANSGGQSVGGSGAATVGSASGTGGNVSGIALGNAPGTTAAGSLSTATARSVGTGSSLQAPGQVQGYAPGTGSAPGISTGASPVTGGHASLAPPQVVGTLVGPNATVNLPQSGLYTINTQPSSQFLVVTDPRFANYSNFISSNYLLQQLGYNPANAEKRLGDGFYEEQQVLDQITDLTGRRFLADDTDSLDQYRDLMNNAVQTAQQFNLSVGVALTPAQMANLTQDIVWLVSEKVDGQNVLVPVVYLSATDAKNLAASGATIAGKNVVLTATGDINNNGTIAASQSAQLTAANLLNSGTISAGNDLSITAAQNILNGGTIKAGGNVSLVAGNDVLSGVSVAQSLGAVQLNGLSSQITPVALNNSALLGSITAGGSLAISAGRDLSLDTAPVMAGSNLSLAAGRDLTATATAISAGGSAQLLAGRDLSLLATGTTTRVGEQMNGVETTTHTVSAVTAGGALTLVAGNDLISQGTQFTGNTVNIGAGNDATLSAVTDITTRTTQNFQGHTEITTGQSDQTVRGTTITGTNGISVAANHDLTITAGTLNSTNGNVALGAGNDLTLNAGQEDHSSYRDTTTKKSGFLSSTVTTTHDASSDSDVIGTNIAGNNVTLAAGHDLTAQSAQVSANQAINLSAGNDVNLTTAQDVHTEEHDTSTKSSSMFSTSALRFGSLDPEWHSSSSSQSIVQTTSVGSLLSGDTVTIAAGHDLTATAAQIAGTHDVTLVAGNNLTLNAGQDTYTETDGTSKSHTGLMNSGGFSVLIGNQTTKTTDTVDDISYTGSLVGSTNGAVTLSAGNNVHITGSDIISQTGTAIVGKNVTIDAALGSEDTTQTQVVHSGGIHVGLSGGAISAAEGVYGAAQGISQSSDSRLKALYAMQAAQDLYSPGAANGMGLAQGQTGASAIEGAISNPHLADAGNANGAQSGDSSGINIQVGLTASTSRNQAKTHDDVTYGSSIKSAGDITIAATGGDLNVIGSQISGNNVALSAAHDLNLLSLAEQHTDTQTSSNASGGVGVSIGSNGFDVYVQAAMGKADAHGNGETHTDTTVTAANTLSLVAGNNATIQGAQATGNTVLANIGNNLTIASEQDTNDYASKQWQAGGEVMFGAGGGGSFSYNQSKTNSNYASVTQVSGIGAGSGGFQISVGGNTDLKGGVIASTADASKNLLDTGSLTFSNIQNQANYSVSSFGISGGGSGSFSAMPSLGVPQGGNASSTTNAAIAPGTIEIQNNPNQDISGLSRNASLSAQGLNPIFNQQQVQENQQLGQLAGQVGMTAAGDLEQTLHLDNGSAGAVAIHTVVGGAVAALGGGNALQGALGAGVGEASIPYLVNAFGPQGAALGSTLVGGLVGGGAGAATANAGALYNYLNHQQRDQEQQDLKSCTSQATCQQVQDYWNKVDIDQNLAVGAYLMAANQIWQTITPDQSGILTPQMAEQLQDTNPASPAYTALLVQGMTNQTTFTNAYASSPNLNPTSIDSALFDQNAMQSNQVNANNAALVNTIAMLRSVDGDPAVGPAPDMTQWLINQNRLGIGVLGPLFGGAGATADVFGYSPQQVAAANQLGVIAFNTVGATRFGALNGESATVLENEPYYTYTNASNPTTLYVETGVTNITGGTTTVSGGAAISPGPIGGGVVPNAMLPHEITQTQQLVSDMGGGTFTGVPSLTPGEPLNGVPVTSPDYPVIDGTFTTPSGDSVPVSLKQLTSSNPLTILQDVSKANQTGQVFGINNVTMIVDAPNIDTTQLTTFANNGPLTGAALNQGVVNTVVVKTSSGYVTITNGSVTNGLPAGWKK